MPEKNKAAFVYIAVGASLMFALCLTIGLLDLHGKLDPILDFIGIPR